MPTEESSMTRDASGKETAFGDPCEVLADATEVFEREF
jgi:hypothetical protein